VGPRAILDSFGEQKFCFCQDLGLGSSSQKLVAILTTLSELLYVGGPQFKSLLGYQLSN
jgi:hypothetical protein